MEEATVAVEAADSGVVQAVVSGVDASSHIHKVSHWHI